MAKLHNTKAKRASAGNVSASTHSAASSSMLRSASSSSTPTPLSSSVTSTTTTVVSASGLISLSGSSSSSVSNTSSTSSVPKVSSAGISATVSSKKQSDSRPNRQTDSSVNVHVKLSSSGKSVETESESLDKKSSRIADSTPASASSKVTEKPDDISARSAKDKDHNRSVKSTVELNKTASKGQDSRAPVNTGEQSSDVIASVVGNAHSIPPSGIKRHKRGRKGALDTPETPITEIVLVMPPEGAEIVSYQTRVKKSKKTEGKYASMDQNEELVTDDVDRDFFYEVHRSETRQFYRKGVKVPVKDEKKDKRHPQSFGRKANTLTESQKRKFEALNKAVKDTDVPVKKPKLYTINPFCLPVSLIDLDS